VDELIVALQSGESFQNRLFLKSGIQNKKGKGPDITLTLNDGCKEYRAKKWNAGSEEVQTLTRSPFLTISGSVDEGDYAGEITIISFTTAPIPENVEPFLSSLPATHKETVKRFSDICKSVTEPNLSRLLRVIFDRNENTWKLFKYAQAAQYRHHAYRGGLIEHSVEVAELCDNSCRVLSYLRRDFLITCALLHDIGKLEEMDHGLTAGEFTEEGLLIGHTVSGAFLIGNATDRIENFPKNLKSSLMHLILSHHGNPEWGAAKTPAFAEAFVLHACDNMSSKSHECHKASDNAAPGQFSVKVGPREYYYIGDLGLEDMPPREDIAPLILTPAQIFSLHPPREVIQTFTTTRLSIQGMVAAGSPEQSSEEAQETREVTLPKIGADYLLRVTGDSMVDAGISPDDLLFVKAQVTANHGEIVVANLDSHGDVVKRLRREPQENGGLGKDWLDSENRAANYPPLSVNDCTRYQGIVVGILKGA
jgi:3'-5' exoribonuclease